jgi:hypothetical protein
MGTVSALRATTLASSRPATLALALERYSTPNVTHFQELSGNELRKVEGLAIEEVDALLPSFPSSHGDHRPITA